MNDAYPWQHSTPSRPEYAHSPRSQSQTDCHPDCVQEYDPRPLELEVGAIGQWASRPQQLITGTEARELVRNLRRGASVSYTKEFEALIGPARRSNRDTPDKVHSSFYRLPRHRGVMVGEIVTFYRTPNTEMLVKILSTDQVTFRGAPVDKAATTDTVFYVYCGLVSRTEPIARPTLAARLDALDEVGHDTDGGAVYTDGVEVWNTGDDHECCEWCKGTGIVGKGPELERCDICKVFPSDEAAREAVSS